ncbi:MAG: cytochrome c, partial [Verrucomicrobiales bacterium]|nr:cytochrome c [Verrucomicrobiales bacterium]
MKKSLSILSPLLAVAFALLPARLPAIELSHHPGKAIYEKLCLECHGADGTPAEGVDSDPLVGSRNIESLAGRIERTMPEDEEDLCVGEDARLVAEYIYHAFYS